MTTRVRFAPSPTGVLHVGGARTALFNYLFARSTGGSFILRIEDTDRARSTEEAVRVILDGLRWLGLTWDEGPYYQSERTALYRARVRELLRAGKAYRCACPAEEIRRKREEARAAKRTYRYDRKCRGRDIPEEVPHTVRLAIPESGVVEMDDLLLGRVAVDLTELDDFIIARTDGTPTYNFTVVVDDLDMRITHVLRGNDHLSNTPKQLLLYEAFGETPPRFGHFALIHGPDGAKLSKRHGASSVLEFREMGYLPETMVSCLVRLGWSCGDREEFTLAELEELFDLRNVGKTAAVFDLEKLLHYNGRFIRRTPVERLVELLRPFLEKRGLDPSVPWLAKAVAANRERSRTLVELADRIEPFFPEAVPWEEKALRKHLKPDRAAPLPRLAEALAGVDRFEAPVLEEAVDRWLEAEGLSLKKVGQAIRVAITGRAVSPPLFDTMEILGRERVLARLRAAAAAAEKAARSENP